MSETTSSVITPKALSDGLPSFRRAASSPTRLRSRSEQTALGERNTPIDLARSFEEVLTAVLSLPWGGGGSETRVTDTELRIFLRGLYEAANGRQVETTIGLIPIAPPVAEFLKAKPYEATSRIGFLIEVATRMLCAPNDETEKGSNDSHNHG